MDLSNVPSNFDNCVFYNAIVKDDYPYDEWEVEYLVNFVNYGLTHQVEEYYRRSERIIKKMRELGVDTDETWIEIDQKIVDPIFESIEDDGDLVDVYRKTMAMISDLEDKYEVN
tara:strand:- start:465 stop:806 length:342 start_codon:yes stop_codon:yes gene_type:complete